MTGKRRAKTEAIMKRRAKFFKALWHIEGLSRGDFVNGRFRDWNGACGSPMCKHPRTKDALATWKE